MKVFQVQLMGWIGPVEVWLRNHIHIQEQKYEKKTTIKLVFTSVIHAVRLTASRGRRIWNITLIIIILTLIVLLIIIKYVRG